MPLSIAIMTVSERFYLVRQLLELIDPVYNTQVFIDHDHKGIWWNAKRCWQSFPAHSTHHLVLQDDITFHPNFCEFVAKKAVQTFPSNPLTFFLGHRLNKKYHSTSPQWLELLGTPSACATLLPVSIILDFLRFEETVFIHHPNDANDDERLKLYLRVSDLKVFAPLPELVQHNDVIPSVVGSAIPDRHSKTFTLVDPMSLVFPSSVVSHPVSFYKHFYKKNLKPNYQFLLDSL